jgi:hypothetical protein
MARSLEETIVNFFAWSFHADAVETDSLDVAACVPEDIVIILSVKN